MDLPAGATARNTSTDRLTIHHLDYGPTDGIPVIMIHGNLATGRFFEHLLPEAPGGYRIVLPDMRGFGDTERLPIDATRGLADWADDTHSLVEALGISEPVHLAGWSTGGAAVARYAHDRPDQVASITLIDPVSPYGFGGCHRDGTPCFADWAGTGGGTGNPEFARRIADDDRSEESAFSPRNIMKSSYWASSYEIDDSRLAMLVDEVLKSEIGDDGYPGDLTDSVNWPGIAPGTRGILNALSGKYCSWADIVDIEPKPSVLWTQGSDDIVVADGSAWEMGTLGQAEMVPGWPGADVFPPQQMVSQIRDVLDTYADRGGDVTMEMFDGSGHGPHIDAADRWAEVFFAFIHR